jgi:hypothetical protein
LTFATIFLWCASFAQLFKCQEMDVNVSKPSLFYMEKRVVHPAALFVAQNRCKPHRSAHCAVRNGCTCLETKSALYVTEWSAHYCLVRCFKPLQTPPLGSLRSQEWVPAGLKKTVLWATAWCIAQALENDFAACPGSSKQKGD